MLLAREQEVTNLNREVVKYNDASSKKLWEDGIYWHQGQREQKIDKH